MPLLKSFYKSSLTSEKLVALLDKIDVLAAAKPSRFVLDRGADRFLGQELASIAIDSSSADACIIINAGSRYGVEAAEETFQDLTFTAKKIGEWYANDVEIEYLDPGDDASLSVDVQYRKISVTLEYALGAIVSTADDVKAAIEAHAQASLLVSIAGTAAVPLSAQALTALAGGSNLQTYGKSDIIKVKRLRTKKYAFVLSPNADPTA